MKSIDGTLLVHSGFWRGTKIHFSLTLPQDDIEASLLVTTRNIFHPSISPFDGSISTLLSSQNHQTASQLSSLLSSLHRIFYAPLAQVISSSETILNHEAATMFQDDKEGFARQVKQNLDFMNDLDSTSPYCIENVESWTPELQTLMDRLLDTQNNVTSVASGIRDRLTAH
jgi:ubiquitin-protein ligase